MIRTLGLAACTACLVAPGAARAQAPSVGPAVEVDRPVLAGAVGDQTVPAAAYTGTEFVVAWRTALWEGEVRAARVTAAGEPRDPRGVLLPGLEGTEARLAVAAGGGSIVVVSAAEAKVQAVRLASEGPLVPGPAWLLASTPGEELGRPAAVWNGSSFWVLWSQSAGGLLATRLSADGQPLDPAPVRLSSTAGQPALRWDGGHTLAAWSTVADGGVVLRAARLDVDGRVLDQPAFELGPLAGARAGPTAVAGNGSVFLVVAAAEGGPDGAAVIAAVRVTAEGRALDAAPFVLAQLAAAPEGGPTVIWNGDRFVVLWAEATGQSASNLAGRAVPDGRLVGADGAVSALGLPTLGAAGEQPVAVAGAGQALTFFARPPGGRGDLDIRGVRLGPQGEAAGPDFLVSGGLNRQGNPALAAGGPPGARRLLLAWEDARQDRLNGDIYAALLDQTGAPFGPLATPLATGTAPQQAPAVAWDGRNFQVAWHERGRGLLAVRLDVDGKVIDRPPLLVPGTGGREALSDPVFCGDDAGALLVWSARRDPGTAGAMQAELRAVRIAPGGNVKEGESLPLHRTYDVSTPPLSRLACAAEAALLVWTGLYQMDRSDLPDLQMALIPRRGAGPLPPVTLLESGAVDERPAVASDGRGFLVAWRPRQVGGARVAIFGTRIDAGGVGLDRPARALGSLNAGHRVSAHWDGAQYVLVGIQSLAVAQFQLRGRRVRPDLGALDPDWFPIDRVSSRRGTGSLPITVGLGAGAAVVAYEAFLDDDATSNLRLRTRLLGTPPLDPAPPPADAGSPDAARPPDAGPAAAGDLPARARGGGCACALEPASPGPGSPLWVALLLVALSRRRRRGR